MIELKGQKIWKKIIKY